MMGTQAMEMDHTGVKGGLLIGGTWRDAPRCIANRSPSDLDDVIGEFALGDAADVEEALDAARTALKTWGRSNPQWRADILRRTGDILLREADRLGRILAREEGKLLVEARGEVMRAVQIFYYFSGECLRPPGQFLPSVRDDFNVTVAREPVGVVAAITPWNFPIAIPAWKTAGALAFGNTVVLKPSEITPASAAIMADALAVAGLPDGVFNLIGGLGADIGTALIRGADAVSFTGSGPTGRIVLMEAARAMKKVQLELGGKSPIVVLADADLDLAIDNAIDGAFRQTGQRCTASSRIVVEAAIHDEFAERMAARVAALKVGHALEDGHDMGPVTTEAQLAKNIAFVSEAQGEGAELLCGGHALERRMRGHYFAPALFAGTDNAMRLNREEVFGPVAGIIKVGDLDEAIAVAADTEYGLSAAICTRNLTAAEKFRREVPSGMVVINGSTSGSDYHAPFGGRRGSGYGIREQGNAAAEFFTEIKTTYFNHALAPQGAGGGVKF
jgi:alpha-ketoglutaric semialdehyde dehydrogenase